jgi:DNA-binding NarL/FixJ family response regulator
LLADTNEGIVVAKIRVVLADDHQGVTAKVRGVLGGDFEVVAAVTDGSQAVDAVIRLDPDVLVIDISMPVLDGLEAAARLQKANCRAKIIFLTIHEDQDYVTAALHVGACGYVTKSRLAADLVLAIRAALRGHTFVSQTVSG